MKNRKLLGNLLLLLTAMIWGTAFVAQRVGMDSIEPITFNAARMWLAAVAIGAQKYDHRRNLLRYFSNGSQPVSADGHCIYDGRQGGFYYSSVHAVCSHP